MAAGLKSGKQNNNIEWKDVQKITARDKQQDK